MKLLITIIAMILVGMAPQPDNGIASALAEWKADYQGEFWLWGLQAIDVNGDGLDDLCVTAHNGGSIILENQGDGTWGVVESGNQLGGTFRPTAFDFDGDGKCDLLFRDSLPNTAYRNTGEGFANIGFAYGTGNDPVRQVGDGWFGHDWERWAWSGSTFKPQGYTNPNYAKLPDNIRAKINADWSKQFYLPYFTETQSLVSVTGAYYYGPKYQSYCHFMQARRGRLIDVSAKLGLPTSGIVVHLDDNCVLIDGQGLYVKGSPWQKVPGPLTDFLAVMPEWPHQVFLAGDRLVVNNVRGQTTKIFKYGTWEQLASVGSWDGEPVAIGDFNGDGKPDIAIGSGGTVLFY